MPLISLQCLNGHPQEQYLATWGDFGALTRHCWCGETCAPAPSFGMPLLYFSEKSPRRILNLDAQREIRSPFEHQKIMREKGLEPATDWHTSKRASRM